MKSDKVIETTREAFVRGKVKGKKFVLTDGKSAETLREGIKFSLFHLKVASKTGNLQKLTETIGVWSSLMEVLSEEEGIKELNDELSGLSEEWSRAYESAAEDIRKAQAEGKKISEFLGGIVGELMLQVSKGKEDASPVILTYMAGLVVGIEQVGKEEGD